jgi:hypothetical protein
MICICIYFIEVQISFEFESWVLSNFFLLSSIGGLKFTKKEVIYIHKNHIEILEIMDVLFTKFCKSSCKILKV